MVIRKLNATRKRNNEVKKDLKIIPSRPFTSKN